MSGGLGQDRLAAGGELGDLDDATIVVAEAGVAGELGELDDATCVVAKPGVAGELGDLDDATCVVVDRGVVDPADATCVVVDRGVVDPADATIVVAKPGVAGELGAASQGLSSERQDRVFTRPLDARRRAPDAPFSYQSATLPRGGVRSGIPVVYGARDEGFTVVAKELDLDRVIGPPPAGYAMMRADREQLPSLARLNRKFNLIAWLGVGVIPVLAGGGLWWVLTELLNP